MTKTHPQNKFDDFQLLSWTISVLPLYAKPDFYRLSMNLKINEI
ncbi:MAG: hypothetical protein QNJ36_08065 [Calothrix sp. MO_167.B42]|nr:hypothetical protein [Calothrix sp. MO_167.B42]